MTTYGSSPWICLMHLCLISDLLKSQHLPDDGSTVVRSMELPAINPRLAATVVMRGGLYISVTSTASASLLLVLPSLGFRSSIAASAGLLTGDGWLEILVLDAGLEFSFSAGLFVGRSSGAVGGIFGRICGASAEPGAA